MLDLSRLALLGVLSTYAFSCSDAERARPTSGPSDASTVADSGSADAAPDDAGSFVDAGPSDSGAPDDAGPPAPEPSCLPSQIQSTCGAPAVVRTVVRLADGAPADRGVLQVRLHHLRLGSGEFGGVPHTAVSSAPGLELSAGAWTQLDLDMCAGGEMWSEDNCEYSLFAFLDLNEDGELNRGEPAARKTMEVSCFADPVPCHDLVLDCLDGASCVAFEADATCDCVDPTCREQIGKIVTCQ